MRRDNRDEFVISNRYSNCSHDIVPGSRNMGVAFRKLEKESGHPGGLYFGGLFFLRINNLGGTIF